MTSLTTKDYLSALFWVRVSLLLLTGRTYIQFDVLNGFSSPRSFKWQLIRFCRLNSFYYNSWKRIDHVLVYNRLAFPRYSCSFRKVWVGTTRKMEKYVLKSFIFSLISINVYCVYTGMRIKSFPLMFPPYLSPYICIRTLKICSTTWDNFQHFVVFVF